MSLAEDIRASLAGGPDTVRVAPGRVNLIGEHTDYSLLPVIPMTIDRSVEVQASVSSATGIRIDSERFPDPIEMYGDLELESLSGWHRYAWAACSTVEAGVGADILIGGDLPAHGGLSSSSALTIALIAALSDLEGRYRTDDEIVDDAVAAERLTGVEGGTMDQNVIVRGRQGHALRIDFAPFALTHLPIPPGMSFVAAYSGRAAAKGGERQRAVQRGRGELSAGRDAPGREPRGLARASVWPVASGGRRRARRSDSDAARTIIGI